MSSRAGNGPKIREPLVRVTRVSWFAGALRRPHEVPWPGTRLGDKEVVMALPEVVSREQWLEARLRLLEQEKELT
jgi:hypothetical protein